MQQSGLPIWNSLRVGRKLALISAGYILLIGAIVAFTILSIREQKSDAVTIDLAGRQRMLTQQFVKEVLLTASGLEADYKATIRMFDTTLEALIAGGTATEDAASGRTVLLAPSPLPGLDTRLVRQREFAERLKTAAADFLAAAAPERPAKLARLLDAQGELIRDANELVKIFSAHSESKLQTMINWEIAIAIVAAVLGMLSSLILARGISQPLAASAELAERIAAGDLRVEHLPVSTGDEIGQLATAFNDMVTSLRTIAGQSRDVTESLSSAAAEILATTQQQASATKQQAAAVQEITSTVEEISQSSAQVAERSKIVATAAQTISATGVSGLEAVRDTTKAIEAIREQAESVAENVVALSERTQAIGAIISTVNDIAEQSNLVALNAAIEAADARGEGRRFAVVANEIKNLADQAKEATGQVRTILEEIQKGINTSVMLTEEAVKRVELGRETTKSAELTIRRMAENIQENVGAFQQIVGATNQQQIGLEQVTQALHEIRQASQQTASSTRELEVAAGNLNGLGMQLRKVMEKYRL